jgi:hypothetical protein
MSDKDKIAALEARIAELEAKGKPPAPFTPEPYQQFDRTAGMSMPPSAIQEMVNAENGIMREVALRDTRAPTSPSSAGAIPSSQQLSNVRGSGWQAPIPLSNPPGVKQADLLMDEQDRRDRAELARKLGQR